MSYRKEFIADGGCPVEKHNREKIISVHYNMDDAPLHTVRVRCDNCCNYFNCTFKRTPCIVRTKVAYRFNGIPMREVGKELRIGTRPSSIEYVKCNLDKIVRELENAR